MVGEESGCSKIFAYSKNSYSSWEERMRKCLPHGICICKRKICCSKNNIINLQWRKNENLMKKSRWDLKTIAGPLNEICFNLNLFRILFSTYFFVYVILLFAAVVRTFTYLFQFIYHFFILFLMDLKIVVRINVFLRTFFHLFFSRHTRFEFYCRHLPYKLQIINK